MIRKSMAGGALLAVFLLIIAAQPVSAQAPTGETWFNFSTDPPTPPWTVDGVGDTTEAFVSVEFCWSAGFNPAEGSIIATVTTESASDELIGLEFSDDTEIEFALPQLETQEEACTDQDIGVVIEVLDDIGPSHTHRFDFTVSGAAEGDIGTFQEPEDQTAQMDIEMELDEPAIPTDDDDEDDGETTGNGDGNAPAEESPAPGFAVLVLFGVGLVALFRRRR